MHLLFIVLCVCFIGSGTADMPAKLKEKLDVRTLKENFMSYPSSEASKDATKYHQKHIPNDEAIVYLVKHGKDLVEVELTNADDTLVKAVVDNCPNIKSFSINPEYFYILWPNLTDDGISALTRLPQLDKLSLNIWYSDVSGAVVQSVLNAQQNLTQLTLWFMNVDACLDTISKYTKLETLELVQPYTTQKFATFLKSSTLAATLKSLDIHAGFELTYDDSVIKNLSAFTKLTTLILHGQTYNWTASEQTVQNLFNALTSLNELDITGLPITSGISQSIGNISQLRALRMDDLSQLTSIDFVVLFQKLAWLEDVSIGQYYGDFQASSLANLSLRKLSLVNCGSFWDPVFTELCNVANIQKNLQELYIYGALEIYSDSFEHLTKLKKLKTLRLELCPYFNDVSMKKISDPKFASNLEALELSQVAISDASMSSLDNFKKLKALMVYECFALTPDGTKALLKVKPFATNITKLYLEVPLKKELLPLFGNFKKIDVLFIGNPHTKLSSIFDLPNIKKNHTFCLTYDGIEFSWKAFTKGYSK